ncbi:MAG: hypothetical protein WD647_01010 [Steroidobacteraceae bacterium]
MAAASRTLEAREVGRAVEVHRGGGHFDVNHIPGRIAQQRPCALVATHTLQFTKHLPGKDRWRRADPARASCNDGARRLLPAGDQELEVRWSDRHLIRELQERRGGRARQCRESRPQRTGKTCLPVPIDNDAKRETPQFPAQQS